MAWYNGAVMKAYYQIGLDVEGKPCLVIGGGEEAVEKIGRLLEAGAQITVVSRKTDPELDALEREGRIAIARRDFRDDDTDGIFLVQLCVKSDPELSARVYRLSLERRFLVGAWDQPRYSTYTMPALVRRGRLRLAISTGATSPGLAGLLREQLGALFDDEFVEYLEWLARRRQELEETEPDVALRRARAREAIRGFRLAGSIEYPEAFTRSKEAEKRRGEEGG